jgi:hypothetical protein
MPHPHLVAVEAKAFVPARDFSLSKRFYEAIGFTLEWSTSDIASFCNGASRFLLQDFHLPAGAPHTAMSLVVEDVDAWWQHVAVQASDFGIAVAPPEDRPWGVRDFPLLDPTGVLWRIGQPLAV